MTKPKSLVIHYQGFFIMKIVFYDTPPKPNEKDLETIDSLKRELEFLKNRIEKVKNEAIKNCVDENILKFNLSLEKIKELEEKILYFENGKSRKQKVLCDKNGNIVSDTVKEFPNKYNKKEKKLFWDLRKCKNVDIKWLSVDDKHKIEKMGFVEKTLWKRIET